MKRAQAFASALCLTLLLCPAPHAQEPRPREAGDEEVIRVSSDLVVLDALVLDKKTGRPVGGLKAEDFELFEDGVRQELGYFGQSELPLSIMLLVDVSGSVRPIIRRVSEGALDALGQLRPEDEVAVMAFATGTRLVQKFTRDHRLVAAKLREASEVGDIGSGTFYEEALLAAAAQMSGAANPASRRVVIVVTDNVGTPAAGDLGKQARAELAESGSVVYGLVVRAAFGKVFNFMTLGLLRPLNSFVDETGGQLVGADKKEVTEKLSGVIAHLRARYNLGYRPSNTREDGRPRAVKLQLTRAAAEAASRRKEKPHVRTRQSYYYRPRRTAP